MELAKNKPSNINDHKHNIFKEGFPNIKPRPFIYYQRFTKTPKVISRCDYTGFELIAPIDRKYRNELCALFPESYDQVYLIPYDKYINEMTDGEPLESFMRE